MSSIALSNLIPLADRSSNPSSKEVTGSTVVADNKFEGHGNNYSTGVGDKKQIVLASQGKSGNDIDISWLRSASDTFDISPDINDYILVDIPIVTASLPNQNMQSFPIEEVSFFDPYMGMMVYKSFIGKAAHMDHDNQEPLKAKGVIFDASLEYVKAYDIWKIKALVGWDRTKDSVLVNSILNGARTGYSMGASINAGFFCSVCSKIREFEPPSASCSHLTKSFGKVVRESDGKDHLVYENMLGVSFFEISSVSNPADHTAVAPHGIYR